VIEEILIRLKAVEEPVFVIERRVSA